MKSKASEKKLYECVLITNYGEIDNIITSIMTGVLSNQEITEDMFSILHRETWGKRTFAYKINKSKKGYYSAIYIQSTSKALAVFDKNLRMHQDIIRFSILANAEIPTFLPPIAENAEK